jgi:hypothetical protein
MFSRVSDEEDDKCRRMALADDHHESCELPTTSTLIAL